MAEEIGVRRFADASQDGRQPYPPVFEPTMFIHKSRLEHLLQPHHYTDEAHYRRELECVFRPVWHPVAVKAELPKPGDFLTTELYGRPVLLRNVGGELQAFLNVCAHRHCLLTHEPRGHAPTLKCQYHGWEYARDGRTARIPDAGCFRPWDRENSRLLLFPTATAGDLVFVSLADAPPPLAGHLGAYHGECERTVGRVFRFAWRWERDYPANWKLPVENSLEGYHIPCLHKKTFGEHPTEENTTHTLALTHSTLATPEPPSLALHIQNWLVRRLGGATKNVYTHHVVHPNLTIVTMDVMRLVQVIVPTSATTCRHTVWMFTLWGDRRGPVSFGVARLLRWLTTLVAKKVIYEDAPIFADLQRGLEASVHPGVIGTLEERVYAFQRYVLERCGGLPPGDRNGTCAAEMSESL